MSPNLKATIKSALYAIVLSLPMALLFILSFRFPIPFAGYIGPFSKNGLGSVDVLDLLLTVGMAWFLYCIFFGGFIVLSLAGVVFQVLGNRLYGSRYPGHTLRPIYAALLSAFVCCLFLATLDYYIGPW